MTAPILEVKLYFLKGKLLPLPYDQMYMETWQVADKAHFQAPANIAILFNKTKIEIPQGLSHSSKYFLRRGLASQTPREKALWGVRTNLLIRYDWRILERLLNTHTQVGIQNSKVLRVSEQSNVERIRIHYTLIFL